MNLARIGRTELLRSLYNQVLIPTAVADELTASYRDLRDTMDIGSIPWLIVAAPKDQDRMRNLQETLDAGEAEAIALAIERRADLLLVDERRGLLTSYGTPGRSGRGEKRGTHRIGQTRTG